MQGTVTIIQKTRMVLLAFLFLTSVASVSHAGSGGANQERLAAQEAHALRVTERQGQLILNTVWPLAFGALQYQDADTITSRITNNGFEVTTMIRYLNLLGSEQFLKLRFAYDHWGECTSMKVDGWSDIIGPRHIPSSQMLEMFVE
jgi:hypothetical protein